MYGSATAGNDRLIGGRRTDHFWGDAAMLGDGVEGGEDIFVIKSNNGTDTIHDFELGKDIMELRNGVSMFADLPLTVYGSDSIVDFGDGNSITVSSTAAGGVSLLTETDFMFA
jgi:hypothetical protein